MALEELESIYDRIVESEIRTYSLESEEKKEVESLAVHRRLASALGLTQLALPFRYIIKLILILM